VSEHREEFLDLCAAQALGNLETPDRARLEAHLRDGCGACEAALSEFSEAVLLLASSAPPVAPPARVRERVLRAARAGTPATKTTMNDSRSDVSSNRAPATGNVRAFELRAPRRDRAALWGWMAAAACLVLALWSWTNASRLRRENAAARERTAQLEQDRVQLEQRLADEKRWAGTMSAANARFATFVPTANADPSLGAHAIVDPATRRAVINFQNLRAPSDRDYQLWAIRGKTPQSLGLLHTDANGSATVRLDDIGDVSTLAALAVSLEPKGGSPRADAPSGPVVLTGSFGS
jgi:anti-sigma-K factor RskA